MRSVIRRAVWALLVPLLLLAGTTEPSARARLPGRSASPVVIDVSPRKATVVVDGTEVGQARDFESRAYPLWLRPGPHVLEFSSRGHQTLRVRLEVKRGRGYRVHYVLRGGEGLDPRSVEAGEDDGGTVTL